MQCLSKKRTENVKTFSVLFLLLFCNIVRDRIHSYNRNISIWFAIRGVVFQHYFPIYVAPYTSSEAPPLVYLLPSSSWDAK